MCRQRSVREPDRGGSSDDMDDASGGDGVSNGQRQDESERALELDRPVWMDPDARAALRAPGEDGVTAPFEASAIVSPDVGFPAVSSVPGRCVVSRGGTNIGVGQLRCLLIGHDPVETAGRRWPQ
jgi:hypothetical protein